MIRKTSKIFLAGHKGLVGSSILKKLYDENFKNIITVDKKKLDLANQYKTEKFLKKTKPDVVIIAAAKVGGINANSKNQEEFLYQNLQIQNNLIMGSFRNKVKNLIFLGSTCIYPKNAKKPLKEKYFLQGPYESTNEGYAIAKTAGIKLCQYLNEKKKVNYKCLMPTNLYGSNDNFDLNTSHAVPALIKKIITAKKKKKKNFVIWGNGKAKRDFMHADDLADACLYFLKIKSNDKIINIGTGISITISALAKKIMKIVKYKGEIIYDKTKPNGMMDKTLDISIANKYGWSNKINLDHGLQIVCKKIINQKI